MFKISEAAGLLGVSSDTLRRWADAGRVPTIRDDLRVCRSYRPSGEPPLPCPLHIFGAHADPLVPPETLTAWSRYSAQPQPVRLFTGDHFLFRRPDPELVTAVARVVADAA